MCQGYVITLSKQEDVHMNVRIGLFLINIYKNGSEYALPQIKSL